MGEGADTCTSAAVENERLSEVPFICLLAALRPTRSTNFGAVPIGQKIPGRGHVAYAAESSRIHPRTHPTSPHRNRRHRRPRQRRQLAWRRPPPWLLPGEMRAACEPAMPLRKKFSLSSLVIWKQLCSASSLLIASLFCSAAPPYSYSRPSTKD